MRALRAAISFCWIVCACSDRGPLAVAARTHPRQTETVVSGNYTVQVARAAHGGSLVWRPAVRVREGAIRFGYVVDAGAKSAVIVETVVRRLPDSGSPEILASTATPVEPGQIVQTRVAIPTLEVDDALSFDAVARDARGMTVPGAIRIEAPMLLAHTRRRRPNVLILCVDTLRADRLRFTGGTRSAMPLLDAWAARGARFTHAYSNSTWTLPAVSTILTGLYPSLHNGGRRRPMAESNIDFIWGPQATADGFLLVLNNRAWDFHALDPSVPTLADMLDDSGYATGAVHQNAYLNHPIGALRGFDDALIYEQRDATVGTDRALEWLERNGSSRFALFLHYIDPHRWPDEVWKQPGITHVGHEEIAKSYDQLCAYTDQQIDRLLREMERRHLLDDTIVVFLADHGELLLEDGQHSGHGGSVDEAVLRVPLIVFGPSVEARTVSARVSLVDVVPTILDYTGVETKHPLSGHTLRPLIEGKSSADRDFRSEFLLYHEEQTAIFEGRWKYVVAPGGDALYDLTADPSAMRNVAAQHESEVRRLRSRYRQGESEGMRRFLAMGARPTPLSPETIASLRALGYTGN